LTSKTNYQNEEQRIVAEIGEKEFDDLGEFDANFEDGHEERELVDEDDIDEFSDLSRGTRNIFNYYVGVF
jgi:hypothetical protein